LGFDEERRARIAALAEAGGGQRGRRGCPLVIIPYA